MKHLVSELEHHHILLDTYHPDNVTNRRGCHDPLTVWRKFKADDLSVEKVCELLHFSTL